MPRTSALPTTSALTSDDFILVVDAPGGSVTTKVITAANAATFFGGVGTSLVDHATPTGTTETIDLAGGNVHRMRWDANVTLSLSNVPATLAHFWLLLYHENTTTSYTVTWWSGIEWNDDATGPTLPAATANGEAFIEFWSFNGGTNWRALHSGNWFP
jgi:hypothetical protein